MDDATDMVQNRGYILNVSSFDGPKNILEKMQSVSVEFGPGLKDVQAFTSQMAVMIKAGINIRSAIEGIAQQVENQKFKKILIQIKDDVESGQPFSEALAKHPKVFSSLYINMVKASELGGNFSHMLERIAAYLSQQIETRSMVRGAMIYPGIIAFMAISTTIFLLTFVLPRFTALFEGKDALLPKPTLILITMSWFMRTYWFLLLGGAIALFCGFFYGTKTPTGKLYWDKIKLKLPIFKSMLRALYITRGLHTMSELISAGVPVLETLKITANISGNILYERLWQRVHDAVKQGEKIATPLMDQNLLPNNVVQMISAGEESGNLGEVLMDVAEFYAKELRNVIKAVTAMIEPLMIVCMGFVVGFIAMSIILPIFKMSSLAK